MGQVTSGNHGGEAGKEPATGPHSQRAVIGLPIGCRFASLRPAFLAVVLLLAPAIGGAQTPAPALEPELIDVFDLVHQLRHKEPPPSAGWDYRKPMVAFGKQGSKGVYLAIQEAF